MDATEPSWVKGVEKAAPLLRVSVWLQCLPLALGLVSGFSECCCETCEVSGFTDTSQVLSLRCQAALARLGDQSEAGTPHLALLALSGVSGGVGLCLGRVLCLGVELSPCELQAGQARGSWLRTPTSPLKTDGSWWLNSQPPPLREGNAEGVSPQSPKPQLTYTPSVGPPSHYLPFSSLTGFPVCLLNKFLAPRSLPQVCF